MLVKLSRAELFLTIDPALPGESQAHMERFNDSISHNIEARLGSLWVTFSWLRRS